MPQIDRRHAIRLTTASVLAAGLPAVAYGQTQNWPQRFVRLVVPFTSGGGIDTIGRIVGARLSEIWGQQVVVENKPGAGGNIASEFVARSDPDGLTMYITAGGLAGNSYLFFSFNYHPVAGFFAVTPLCFFFYIFVGAGASSFPSLRRLLSAGAK